MNSSLKAGNQSKTDGSKFILQNHFPINDIEVWQQTDRENVDKISCRQVILLREGGPGTVFRFLCSDFWQLSGWPPCAGPLHCLSRPALVSLVSHCLVCSDSVWAELSESEERVSLKWEIEEKLVITRINTGVNCNFWKMKNFWNVIDGIVAWWHCEVKLWQTRNKDENRWGHRLELHSTPDSNSRWVFIILLRVPM